MKWLPQEQVEISVAHYLNLEQYFSCTAVKCKIFQYSYSQIDAGVSRHHPQGMIREEGQSEIFPDVLWHCNYLGSRIQHAQDRMTGSWNLGFKGMKRQTMTCDNVSVIMSDNLVAVFLCDCWKIIARELINLSN